MKVKNEVARRREAIWVAAMDRQMRNGHSVDWTAEELDELEEPDELEELDELEDSIYEATNAMDSEEA